MVVTASFVVVVLPVTHSRAATSFTFGAVGDHAASARSMSVFQAVGASDPDFFLSLGDLSYDQVTPPACARWSRTTSTWVRVVR